MRNSWIALTVVLMILSVIACSGGDDGNTGTSNTVETTEQTDTESRTTGSNYEIEGRITSIVDSQSFYLGNTLVTHDSSTRFEDGNASDLAVGKRVEVEGTRTSSGTVIAREIEFDDDD